MARATENGRVRLVSEDKYHGGEPYVDWMLLRDCPEIPAARLGVVPAHAIAGDVLREEQDEDLTPFRLLRNGRQIGSPEWYQVRHLFEGITPTGQGGTEAEPDPIDALIIELGCRPPVVKAVQDGEGEGEPPIKQEGAPLSARTMKGHVVDILAKLDARFAPLYRLAMIVLEEAEMVKAGRDVPLETTSDLMGTDIAEALSEYRHDLSAAKAEVSEWWKHIESQVRS